MSSIIGKVKSINGLFNIKSGNGSERKVTIGDNVYEKEMIVGEQKNSPKDSLVLLLNDGSELVVLGNTKQLLDSSILSEAFTKEEAITQKDSFLALLEANNNIGNMEDLETAAGETLTTQSTESPEAVFLETNYTLSNINTDLREISFQEELADFNIDINEDIRRTNSNEALSLIVTPIAALTEDSVSEGTVVATSSASDEDGGAITFTISDTDNYAIDSATGEVTLTTAGAAIVNGGSDLPNFIVTATSSNSTSSQEVNLVDTTAVNDPASVVITGEATQG